MRRSNAAVVNAVSMGLGLIEMAVFGCACYGFPYIQYILEEEKLFMTEYCTEEEILEHIHCTKAKEIFGLIWTLTLSCSIIGDLLISLFQEKFGFFAGRTLAGSFFTIGFAVMGMYKSNPFLMFVGQLLISLPAYRSFSQNIALGKVYMGKNSNIATILFPGFWMFSFITFLLGKKLTDLELINLPVFLFMLSGLTVIIHLRTIFFLPRSAVPNPVPDDYNLFEDSIVGNCSGEKNMTLENPKLETINEKERIEFREFVRMLLTPRFFCMTVVNIIVWNRCASAMGQFNAWLDYAYSEDSLLCENDPGDGCFVDENKSEIIDMYGYMNCLHVVTPFAIVALLNCFKKCFASDESGNKAILSSFIFQLSVTFLHVVAITIIMMMKIPEGGGKGLPLALATLMTTMQPFYMSCPQIFVYTFYPRHLAPKIFIVINLIYLPTTFTLTPLYNFLIVGSIAEYNFITVSYIFFGFSAVFVFFLAYLAYDAKKFCEEKERENTYKNFVE